ncbi:MAG: ATP/GTP-binding protein [Granulosicoccus sp.]
MDHKATQICKVLVAGSVGVGKTTAVSAASDTPILTTEVQPTDDTQLQKKSTTVAMDFNVVWLDDGFKVHLYGTPGQKRFDFMWGVLAKGTAGVVLLANHQSPDVFDEMRVYLDAFQPMIHRQQLVVGVTRMGNDTEKDLQKYRDYFTQRDMRVPVLEADPRSRHDVIILIRASLAAARLGRQE